MPLPFQNFFSSLLSSTNSLNKGSSNQNQNTTQASQNANQSSQNASPPQLPLNELMLNTPPVLTPHINITEASPTEFYPAGSIAPSLPVSMGNGATGSVSTSFRKKSSISSAKKVKKLNSGRKSFKSKQFHTVTFSQGAGFRAPPKEDRIISIEDLYTYVHKTHSSYNTTVFGDPCLPPEPSKIFILPGLDEAKETLEKSNSSVLSKEGFAVNIESTLNESKSAQMNANDFYGNSPMNPGNAPIPSFSHVKGYSLSSSAPESSGFLRSPLSRGINIFRSDTSGSEVQTPQFLGSDPKPESELAVDKFKLFAVFDGHCGKIAASFLQYRFPLELCGSVAFKEGRYEQALKDTYHAMHDLLKKCTKYAPERPYSDYSSGATASVVLVTPTMTFFAFLGDSPIITWRVDEPRPEMLFPEHDADNPIVQKNILESNIFLVLVREKMMSIVYYLVTQPIVKQALFRMAHEQQVEGGAVHDLAAATNEADGHDEHQFTISSLPESTAGDHQDTVTSLESIDGHWRKASQASSRMDPFLSEYETGFHGLDSADESHLDEGAEEEMDEFDEESMLSLPTASDENLRDSLKKADGEGYEAHFERLEHFDNERLDDERFDRLGDERFDNDRLEHFDNDRLQHFDNDRLEDEHFESERLRIASDMNSLREARLHDDHAKVVVLSEEEILREETERLNKSAKGSIALNESRRTLPLAKTHSQTPLALGSASRKMNSAGSILDPSLFENPLLKKSESHEMTGNDIGNDVVNDVGNDIGSPANQIGNEAGNTAHQIGNQIGNQQNRPGLNEALHGSSQAQGETLEYDDIRVGLSALNVYGSIGDSSYDPDIFNAFLDEIVAFKAHRINELAQSKQEMYHEEMANFTVMSCHSGVIPFTHNSVASNPGNGSPNSPGQFRNQNGTPNPNPKTPGAFAGRPPLNEDFDPNDFSFEEFRSYIMARPNWDVLKNHMFLMKSEDKCSRILLAAIRYLDNSHRLTRPGLLRTPETKAIPTNKLRTFIITSDGVIRFYEKFKEQFQTLIMRHLNHPERLAGKLKDYMKWLGDDRSIIICKFEANFPERRGSAQNPFLLSNPGHFLPDPSTAQISFPSSKIPPDSSSPLRQSALSAAVKMPGIKESPSASADQPSFSPGNQYSGLEAQPPLKGKLVSSKKLYHQLRNRKATVTLPPVQPLATSQK